MGTTKAALQAGSYTGKLVVAIEGYSHLLSDATEAQVQAAWTGTDWASNTIIPGLTIDAQLEQRIDPWQPFHGGGSVTLSIKDSITDTFGIDTHRKTAGDETYLGASLDADDTTVTVLSASDFASSGEIHIGTECICYAGTTGTTFTTCTRGKYSPFGVDGGTRFGRPHRVRNDPNGVTLKPQVTQYPRTWLGRMVGVWMHRDVGGTLDTKAEAQLIFAGRIVEVRDDPTTQSTLVECEHILDWISDVTLGREMWAGKFEGGIFLGTGDTFSMADIDDAYGSGTTRTATDLVVVASGATAPYEINAGVYTAPQLHSALNAWWGNALLDTNLYGSYSITLTGGGTDDARTRIYWTIPNPTASSTTVAKWTLTLPRRVAIFLGYGGQIIGASAGYAYLRDDDYAHDTAVRTFASDEVPYRSLLDIASVPEGPLALTDETGAFADQLASLPTPLKWYGGTLANHDWGLVLVDDKYVVRVARNNATFKYLKSAHVFTPFFRLGTATLARRFNEPAEFSARQIFVVDAPFGTLLKEIFYSTGTAAYNHATYDTLPFGLGFGVPGTLLGDAFEAAVDNLPGANLPQVLVLDKPTQVAEVLTGDLVVRWAFPLWKDQAITIATWPTPVTGAAVATLSEATKAAPAGQDDNHRTASILTDAWQRTIIKWEYERNFEELGDAKYISSKTFEDPGAIDDCGGQGKPITLKLPNLFGDAAQVGAGVNQLVPYFMGILPIFTRGTRVSTRSIDPRYYEGYGVGDVVLVTDEFARDPDTGTRGTSRPGVLVRHRWQPGGGVPGEAREMSGEVDVMFLEQNRIAQYVPCAQVDETATNAGYDAGTKVLTCYAHKHSESSEAADASYFVTDSAVRVIEIDPSDPTSPLSWDDVVASQTGNTITLTTGLAGWDNTKRYRVVSDTYGDATATQQTSYSYQADDADGLVANARAPYQYASGLPESLTVTANSATDQLELPPNGSYGDGVGRDVGHEAALVRLVTNVIDYKAAHSSPVVHNSTMSGVDISGTYKLVEVRPVFLTGETFTARITRNVSASAWYRSSDGASATVRISLVRALPSDATTSDIERGTIYSEVTFTTTSTSWTAATADDLDASPMFDGIAYLLVECTASAETRGACKLQVSARTYS